jgi:hypothetical protein
VIELHSRYKQFVTDGYCSLIISRKIMWAFRSDLTRIFQVLMVHHRRLQFNNFSNPVPFVTPASLYFKRSQTSALSLLKARGRQNSGSLSPAQRRKSDGKLDFRSRQKARANSARSPRQGRRWDVLSGDSIERRLLRLATEEAVKPSVHP